MSQACAVRSLAGVASVIAISTTAKPLSLADATACSASSRRSVSAGRTCRWGTKIFRQLTLGALYKLSSNGKIAALLAGPSCRLRSLSACRVDFSLTAIENLASKNKIAVYNIRDPTQEAAIVENH